MMQIRVTDIRRDRRGVPDRRDLSRCLAFPLYHLGPNPPRPDVR